MFDDEWDDNVCFQCMSDGDNYGFDENGDEFCFCDNCANNSAILDDPWDDQRQNEIVSREPSDIKRTVASFDTTVREGMDRLFTFQFTCTY